MLGFDEGHLEFRSEPIRVLQGQTNPGRRGKYVRKDRSGRSGIVPIHVDQTLIESRPEITKQPLHNLARFIQESEEEVRRADVLLFLFASLSVRTLENSAGLFRVRKGES